MIPGNLFEDVANISKKANEIINKETIRLPEWIKDDAVISYGYLLTPLTVPIKIEYGHLSDGKLLLAYRVNDRQFFDVTKAVKYAMALKLIEYISVKFP